MNRPCVFVPAGLPFWQPPCSAAALGIDLSDSDPVATSGCDVERLGDFGDRGLLDRRLNRTDVPAEVGTRQWVIAGSQ